MYYTLLPCAFLVFCYGVFKLIVFKKITFLYSAVSLIFSLSCFFIILHFKTVQIACSVSLFVVILLTLVFGNLYKKSSVIYLILLLVIETSLFVIMVFYKDYGYLLGYLMVGVFILLENNQKFLRKTYEISSNEYQNKIIAKQIEEVEVIYSTMREWRHDYHNHLQSLKAYLKLEQIEEANHYLGELEQDLQDVKQLIETGNITLDAILNSKLSLAINHNIHLDYKVVVPKKLGISDLDLCVLLGNLIDNAVEACDKVENEKFIRLYIGVFKAQFYISVTNATKEVIRKLDEEYITNKRGNHGHGLKRINHIVQKYDGYINRKNEPGVFVTEIMLPL